MRLPLALAGLLAMSACALAPASAIDALVRSGALHAFMASRECLPTEGFLTVVISGVPVHVAHADLIARGLVQACP